MYKFQMSVFLKTAGAALAATIANAASAANSLLHPDELRAGDHYERGVRAQLSFESSADRAILEGIFAMCNGEGSLPQGVSLPRSISVGDIITNEQGLAYLITEEGFRRIAFTPRGETFTVTSEHLGRKLTGPAQSFYPFQTGQTAEV